MKIKWAIKREVWIIATLAVVIGLVVFAEKSFRRTICNNIVVKLDNLQENHFMDEADILKVVERSARIKAVPFDDINFRDIERRLGANKNIQKVQIYNDLKGNMIVNVSLRRPIARLVQEDGADGYLSEEGFVMPTSDRFTSRVMIISGAFVRQALNQQDIKTTETGTKILELLRFISGDEFWKAQISQIDIDEKGKILLYPQITNQVVTFGNPENLEEKFRKLKIFYKKILPQRGWNQYTRVNIEFDGQVIASK